MDRQIHIRRIASNLVAAHKALSVFDPLDLFCDQETCDFADDDVLYFYDKLHLSVRGSRHYAKHFLFWLASQVDDGHMFAGHPPVPVALETEPRMNRSSIEGQ